MSLISFSTISDGTTATASQVNTPLTTIYNDYNGNITDANVASGAAIAANKLAGGTAGMFGAWSTWTPSWTNLTTGNGTLTYSKYIQIGKLVRFRLHFIWGSTTSASGTIIFTLPTTLNSDHITFTFRAVNSNLEMRDNSAATSIFGLLSVNNSTSVSLQSYIASGTATSLTNTSAAVPFTWAVNDIISCSGEYETA